MGSLPALQPVQVQPPDIANALATRYQLQQMQQKQASQNALMQAGPGLVSGDDKQFQNSLSTLAQYDPQTALQLQSTHAAQKKAAADLQWDQLSKSAQVYGAISQLPDDQIVSGAQKALEIAKSHGADTSQIEPIVASGDPAKIRQFVTLAGNVATTRADQIKQQDSDRDYGLNVAKFGADEKDKAATRALTASSQGETARHNKEMEAGAGVGLDEDTLNYAADKYRATGQMPALGMKSAAARTAILVRAQQRATAEGSSGLDDVALAAGTKASSASLSAVRKNRSMVESFGNTASMNADLALGLLDKGAGPTGVPALDRWVRAGGKSISGDPDVTNLDTAIKTFKNEYAKIMSGATGAQGSTDGARHEADELISPNMSKEQIKQGIAIMKQEMQNRHQSLIDEETSLTNSLRGNPQAPATTPQAAPAAVGGAGWSIQKLP